MSLFKEKPKTEREKVEERREEVLAQGRKFKYPLQYSKHKVIINTVIVGIVAIVAMLVVGWALLYKLQDTGNMIYRVTQVLPISVAEVDGASVRYSDYLMIYRSNLETSKQQDGQLVVNDDSTAMQEMYKEAAMRSAVEYTYALKLSKTLDVTVTEEEIDKAFEEHRKVGGVERSEESFLKIVRDNFGMNKSEYRRMLYLTLMKSKVAQEVDTHARDVAGQVEQMLAENGGNLFAVAEALGGDVEYEETGRLVDKMNVDGGRANEAMKLELGAVSGRFLSTNGDAYYFVKLNEKNDTQVNYASLKIKLTEFDLKVAELYENGQVKEYITLGGNGEE